MLKRRRRHLEEQTMRFDEGDQSSRKRQTTVLDVTAMPDLSDASSVATSVVTPSVQSNRTGRPRGQPRENLDGAQSAAQARFQRDQAASQGRKIPKAARGLEWEPLSERQRPMIRKLFQATYNRTIAKYGSVAGNTTEDNNMKTALQNLMKVLDKRMQRTLIPKLSREFLFDPEILEKKIAELEKQMEGELEEIEELETSLARAEYMTELQKMQMKQLQETTKRDEEETEKMEKKLYERCPLLQMPPDSSDYVRSLILYPSSHFT